MPTEGPPRQPATRAERRARTRRELAMGGYGRKAGGFAVMALYRRERGYLERSERPKAPPGGGRHRDLSGATNRYIFMAGGAVSACADDLFGDLASTVGSSESKTKKAREYNG
ncbi:MAG: hypothetical protein METHAR1v1_1220002 [Methanothrix sp.]|nr:MAG: hypothetical protein METHAR1v1_1220002 [Methanothrix sp.]